MKFKKSIFVFAILLVLISIGSVAASEDVNTSVSNSGDLTTKYTMSFAELNETINAPGINEYNLTGDVVYNETTDTAFKRGIEISKTITINGNNFTIDGKNTARIFSVTNTGSLTLNNITLTNGKNIGGGAS